MPKLSHGMSRTRFYQTWNSMRGRCLNKNHTGYPKYGGKGVSVCGRWLDFNKFKEDMYESYLEHVRSYGEKNTQIDRIDFKGIYERDNCRWATIVEQAQNKCNTRYFPYRGNMLTINDLARELGTTKKAITNRIYKFNWSINQILEYYGV